jgi:hypothetical protein
VTYVALALVVLLATVLSIFTGLLTKQHRAHTRREDLLVNQVLHLAGKTWTPPPAETWTAPQPGEPLIADPLDWTPTPEQTPLYT